MLKYKARTTALIGLVCKTCAVAFAAIDCAVKRTVAGCAGAFAKVVVPGGKFVAKGVKGFRAAKYEKWNNRRILYNDLRDGWQ